MNPIKQSAWAFTIGCAISLAITKSDFSAGWFFGALVLTLLIQFDKRLK